MIRRKRKNYVLHKVEYFVANLLNHEFHADQSMEKLFDRYAEIKSIIGSKSYLSTICDLKSKKIVAYEMSIVTIIC